MTNLVDAEPALGDRRLPPAVADRDAFRMSKHDLRARPIYHHKRECIDAHLAVVFAALAVSHLIEDRDRLDDQEVRPHRSAATAPSRSTPAATPSPPPTRLPDDVRQALAADPARVRTNLAQVGLTRDAPSFRRLRRSAYNEALISLSGASGRRQGRPQDSWKFTPSALDVRLMETPSVGCRKTPPPGSLFGLYSAKI